MAMPTTEHFLLMSGDGVRQITTTKFPNEEEARLIALRVLNEDPTIGVLTIVRCTMKPVRELTATAQVSETALP